MFPVEIRNPVQTKMSYLMPPCLWTRDSVISAAAMARLTAPWINRALWGSHSSSWVSNHSGVNDWMFASELLGLVPNAVSVRSCRFLWKFNGCQELEEGCPRWYSPWKEAREGNISTRNHMFCWTSQHRGVGDCCQAGTAIWTGKPSSLGGRNVQTKNPHE